MQVTPCIPDLYSPITILPDASCSDSCPENPSQYDYSKSSTCQNIVSPGLPDDLIDRNETYKYVTADDIPTWVTDNVFLGIDSRVPSPISQYVVAVSKRDGGHTSSTGTFGLSAVSTQNLGKYSQGNETKPTILHSLYEKGSIPSVSFSYAAGYSLRTAPSRLHDYDR